MKLTPEQRKFNSPPLPNTLEALALHNNKDALSITHRNGLIIAVGRVGNFSFDVINEMLSKAVIAYLEAGTMGDEFILQAENIRKLFVEFASGFSVDHSLVLVSKILANGNEEVVGGCVLEVGKNDQQFVDLIGKNNASFSTLQSLDFSLKDDQNQLAQTQEKECFEISRFFRVDTQLCEQYDIDFQQRYWIVAETLMGIQTAKEQIEEKMEISLGHGLANVSNSYFLSLVKKFGWTEIANKPSLTANIPPVLQHHFDHFVSNTTRENITIIAATSETLEASVRKQEDRANKVHKSVEVKARKEARYQRQEYQEFLDELNSGKIQPRRFDMSDPSQRQAYQEFTRKNDCLFIDTRLLDLIGLYERFNAIDVNFDSDNPYQSPLFRKWLKDNDFKPPFYNQGTRLVIPQAEVNGKILWKVINVLPENIQRQIGQASAWKMLDKVSVNTENSLETRKILYDDVDVVVIGGSVGSMLSSTLVASLGINNMSLVDFDIQDGIGNGRVANPSLSSNGKLKIIKTLHNLLEVSPYLNHKLFPEGVTRDNIKEVLSGVMPENPNRRLVIIEEISDSEFKDLLRDTMREMYSGDDRVVMMSVADIGRAAIQLIIETPEDQVYAGVASEHKGDLYGNEISIYDGSENPLDGAKVALSKILASYGLITSTKERSDDLTVDDLKVPPELVHALNHLLTGQITSFEQSGLATRLAGVLTSAALLSWLEGNLEVRQLYLDLSHLVDSRWKDQAFLKEIYVSIMNLQSTLGIDLE